jgi:beta-lactamase superfamily II metal-dependent hydrolase
MVLNISHPFASVTYINVDQGDSILIRLAYNRANILIDTGKPSKYIYLDSYLKAVGVKRIDYLVLTHNDSDHNGNKQKLIDNYIVKNIIEKDKDIIIGDFKMLSLNNQNYDNDNDNSLVYYFELNNLSFLMTGDISKTVERDIIKKYNGLECDILKLSHHGSKTGPDSAFIKKIKPTIAIISNGNTYHHPHQETLDILEENHIFHLQTKTKGDIEIYFTYFLNIISDYSRDFAIINNRWY